jgi:hypothetical protein
MNKEDTMEDFQDWSWTAEWQEEAAERMASESEVLLDFDLFFDIHAGMEPF